MSGIGRNANGPGGRGAGRRPPPAPRAARRPPRPPNPADEPQFPLRRVLLGVALGSLTFAFILAAVLVTLNLTGRDSASRESDTPETPPVVPIAPEPPTEPPPFDPGLEDVDRPEPGPTPSPPAFDPDEPCGPGVSEPGAPAEAPVPETVPDDSTPPEAAPPSPFPPLGEDPFGPPSGEPGAATEGGLEPVPGPTSIGDLPGPDAPPKTPFEDVAAQGGVVPLPLPGSQEARAGLVRLVSICVDSPQECELSLRGGDVVFGEGLQLAVRCQDAADGTRCWQVSLGGGTSLAGAKKIGEFVLKDGALWFVWEDPTSPSGAALQFCLLHLEAGQEEVDCVLWQPQEIPPPRIDGQSRARTGQIRMDPKPPEEIADLLQVEFQPQGFPEHEIRAGPVVKLGQAAMIHILDGAASQEALLEIEVLCRPSDPLQLCYKIYGYQRTWHPKRGMESKRELVDRDWAEKEQKKFGEIRNRVQFELAQRRTEEKRLTNMLEILESNRPQSSSSVDPTALQLWATQRAMLNGQIMQTDTLVQQGERVLEIAKTNEAWSNDVLDAFNQLAKSGCMGLRIFADIDGHQVDVLRTNSQSLAR